MARWKVPTIWEVLGVCAIIAVLVAIFFPVFVQAPKHSRFSCIANEKQLGLGLLQYARDNEGRLPPGRQGSGVGWGGSLIPYTQSSALYECPDDTTTASAPESVVSYADNSNTAQHPWLNQYPVPEHTVLLFEVSGVRANLRQKDEGASQGAVRFSAAGDGTDGTLTAGRAHAYYATGALGGRPLARPTQIAEARHHGGSNFLFADGHTRWLQPAQVSSGSDAHPPTDQQTGGLHGSAASSGDEDYAATFSVK